MPLDTPKKSLHNFDLLNQVKVKYAELVVSKWRSRISGLTLVHVDYQAPIVHGNFVVRTEIFNDSGCPHTLEHLVFMGSEKYPYKGVLDNLATRNFTWGTNAWTAMDHTTYTISTAGGQGFLQMLPVFVDHILYPTLTPSSFETEVHHIQEDGRDSGVVYSEMQGRENTSSDIAELALQRLANPAGSAYRSETGGLMEALRVLTIDDIRKYHRDYYVPYNLSLIISGKLSTHDIIQVLQDEVEPSAVKHVQNHGPRGPPGFKRPFVETPSAARPAFETTIKETVEFPERDESMGQVFIRFRGSTCGDLVAWDALCIICRYLMQTATAPLNRDLVEITKPLCSSISWWQSERAEKNDLEFIACSVPTDELATFDEKVIEILKRVVDAGFDMKKIQTLIQRERRNLLNSLESDNHDYVARLIADFLYYGEDGEDLDSVFNDMELFDEVGRWTQQQWNNLVQTYFIDAHRVVVCAKPSSALQQRLESEENARVECQVKKFGPDGLRKLGDELEAAKQENDQPVPQDILTSFSVPSVSSISWISVTSAQNRGRGRLVPAPGAEELAAHIANDGAELSVFVSFHNIESQFFAVNACISTAMLPDNLRPLLAVYAASFLSLPVTRSDGKVLTYEEVVDQLNIDTVLMGAGVSEQVFIVTLKVEISKYETAVTWLKELLFNSHFDLERLRVTVAKLQQRLPESKRDGMTARDSILTSMMNTPASNRHAANIDTQLETIPRLVQRLREDVDAVVADFEAIRKYLISPEALRFRVAGPIMALPNPRLAWKSSFGDLKARVATPDVRQRAEMRGKVVDLLPIPHTIDTLNELGRHPHKKAVVATMPTIETTYATFATSSISRFDDADLPALEVALEVMNAKESFLWRAIRGSGLSYDARVTLEVESGTLKFTLYRSPNSYLAYASGSDVVRKLVNGSIVIQQSTLDSAKSTLVYDTANSVSTPGKAAWISFVNQVWYGTAQDRHIQMLHKYQEVTTEQVLAALKKYVLPVFEPATSIAAVTCAPTVADKVAEGLRSVGYDVEARMWGAGADGQ